MNKTELIHNITPLQKLEYSVGKTHIYMKRDDLIEFGGGGNKVRLFEYIASDIESKGVDKIITFGSIHSNHVRVTAVVAAWLSINCDLIILSGTDQHRMDLTPAPNLKLTTYCNDIHIEYCKTEYAHDFIDAYLTKQLADGIKYYWIPGGGHTTVAVQGYADVCEELLVQSDKFMIIPDAIFVPCGTGTTQAGLIKGMQDRIRVIGITVSRDINKCKFEIASLLGIDNIESDKSIEVLPNPIGYGEIDYQVEKMINELVRSDGIYLDPIYNAKSFMVMVKYLEAHPELENVIYINTGGYPNLFM